MPKISVLMPVFDTHPEHLRESMESILAQTYRDFEFLILNDCSTEPGVEEIVKSYDDPRIVYAANTRNMGISDTRNRLLDMAKGEFLAIMDHDDISHPARLEKQAALLESRPEVGVVGCLVENMETGRVKARPADDAAIKKMLMIHCDLSHPSCMIRRSVLESAHIRYESLFSPAEDYALFARLIPVTKFAILQETLFRYRAWFGNTSHRRAREMEAAAEGVHAFMRRDNPEIWAMAQNHLQTIRRYRILGVPVLSVVKNRRETRWLLFDGIPFLRAKDALPRIVDLL